MKSLLIGDFAGIFWGMLAVMGKFGEQEVPGFMPGIVELFLSLLCIGGILYAVWRRKTDASMVMTWNSGRMTGSAAQGRLGRGNAKGVSVSAFVTVVALVIAAAIPAVGAYAEQAPTVAIEMKIVHGKVSMMKNKREVSKARINVVLDDVKRSIKFPLTITGYTTASAGGNQTQFIESATPAFEVAAHHAPGGVEVSVNISYNIPAPVPEAYVLTGVLPHTAIRGFDMSTRIALPAKEGASVEIGSIEDPVADRAWSATVTVVGVKGAVSPGTLPKNTNFIAKVEENDGKKSTTTTLRITSSNAEDFRITDRLSVPFSSVSAAGANVSFIDFPVELRISTGTKDTDIANVQLRIARKLSTAPGKETWPILKIDQKITLTEGAPADLGSVSEGGRTVHASLEQSTE